MYKPKVSLVHVFFVTWGLIALLGVVYSLHAQDEPQINTYFEQGCIEVLSSDHYRLHFHYTSDGAEQFKYYMGLVEGSNIETLPYNGNAFANVPPTLETEMGYHDDWYLDAHSEDSPYTFHLMFQNAIGTADLPLNTWDNQEWCEAGQYAPTPTPMATITLTPDENAGNGQVEPFSPMPQIVISTGRTCVVKYPEIILVCSG